MRSMTKNALWYEVKKTSQNPFGPYTSKQLLVVKETFCMPHFNGNVIKKQKMCISFILSIWSLNYFQPKLSMTKLPKSSFCKSIL